MVQTVNVFISETMQGWLLVSASLWLMQQKWHICELQRRPVVWHHFIGTQCIITD